VYTKSYPILLLIGLLIIGFSACSPSEEVIAEAIASTMDAWTPIPTFTSVPPIVLEVTRIVEVPPTLTSTPLFTSTITLTPTITNTPTQTPTFTITPNATQTADARVQESLKHDKGNGFFLVNIDIAPGVWRSNGSGDSCYWATTTKTGSIIDNHFGMSGGTAYISPSAFQVEFKDCGTWTFLSPP